MAIIITVIDSAKQVVAGIPKYINVSIDINANVYYTFDGSTPNQNDLSTMIMEHNPGYPLNGVIFLPTDISTLDLNILAIGSDPNNIGTFYRRYGLENKKLNYRGHHKPIKRSAGIIVDPSENTTIDNVVISSDGYTSGKEIYYDLTGANIDGYDDGYYLSVSGQKVALPAEQYDHIIGYSNSDDEPSNVITTTLTPGKEQNLNKLSNRGNIFIAVPDPTSRTGSKLVSNDNLINIDPRSSNIIDENGGQIEDVPDASEPAGYTLDIDGNIVNNDIDNMDVQQTSIFTGRGIFNPRAAFIEIDGRVDGYLNGEPIQPGDRVIINKPYGELRYAKNRSEPKNTNGYISGGITTVIYDYNKGQAAFYYHDFESNRNVVSLQKIDAPQYEIVAKRNGVVIGWVFKWITGKRQVMPG